MDTASLEIFAAVFRAGSLAAVARERGVDPSLVSRAVAGLEEELGIKLFARSTRRLVPTDAGKLYFERIEKILADLDSAHAALLDVGDAPSGVVRLTVSIGFGKVFILPLMEDFQKENPNIVLDLMLDDGPLDLTAKHIDLAIRLGPPITEGNLIVRRLMHTRYAVCASPAYLARHGAPTEPSELAARDCILINLPGFRSAWKFRKDGEEFPVVSVKGNLLVSHAFSARQSAEAGLGPTLLADWMMRDAIEAGTLVNLFPDFEVAALSFDTGAWLVYPQQDHIPLKTRRVIDFLTARLARRREPFPSARRPDAPQMP
jgi:DNA-binding transcriptional LysR family regulator